MGYFFIWLWWGLCLVLAIVTSIDQSLCVWLFIYPSFTPLCSVFHISLESCRRGRKEFWQATRNFIFHPILMFFKKKNMIHLGESFRFFCQRLVSISCCLLEKGVKCSLLWYGELADSFVFIRSTFSRQRSALSYRAAITNLTPYFCYILIGICGCW